MKQNFKQKLMAGLLSVCMIFQTVGIVPVYAAENVMDSSLSIGTSSVCTHHVHDGNCGYTEGTPCTHVHTDECSAEVKNCVHEHTAECYPVQDSGEATGSEAKEPTACTHICDEKSGCITKELACKHVHDDKCGYKEGKPCTFDTATCESCNPKNTVDNRATLAVGEVYAVYDGSKFYVATAEAPTVPTTPEITNKNTINNLYIMGASVPDKLIGDSNSDDNTNLKTVTCADSVTSIGTFAFSGCTGLTSVAMPNVISIGENAFAYCKILASVDVSKVTTIGNQAFLGCAKLTSVAMPKVTSIGDTAFKSCARLESVAMPKVTTIGDSAFNDCTALASLTLGATPPTVGTDAFYQCSKTDALTIQGNTAIQDTVLADYKAAADGNVTDNLWYGWTLPATMVVTPSAGTLEVTTGNSTSNLGQDNAITLTATFDKAAKIGKQMALTINQVEFKDGANTLGTIAAATQNSDGKWVATLNVNTKDWAAGAHNLTATFAGNHELGDATATLTVTVNVVYAVYDGSKFCAATADAPSTATETVISDKKTINNLYIMGASVPDSLIGDSNAVNKNTTLKTVTCANTVTSIGDSAFYNCTSLASAVLPSATSIGEGTFFGCTALTSVAMPQATNIGTFAFSETALTIINMPQATTIGDNAFNKCASLTSVEMPKVTSIGDSAFYNCTSLASVAMPKVTSIGIRAFERCTALTSAKMPKVTSIDNSAFYNCTSLASVVLPSATSIGTRAFQDCTALASLTLGATPPTVGTNAFTGCSNSRTLTIQGNPAYQTEVLAAYKAVNDGATDELWYGWTLPTALDGTGVSNSAGTLAVTTGNAAPTFGTDNAITLTATFDKAANMGKQRALAINEVEFKDGTNTLGAIATATKNSDGKWVATLDVNTKDWAVGVHNLTATFAGNHELLGASTTNEVTVTINKIDQAALNISGVPNSVTYGDSNFTLSATGGSGNGAVTYAVTAGNDVVSVTSAGEVTVLKAGTATITATKAGGTNYNDATATTTITVNAAVPTLAWADAAKTETLTYTGSVAWITKIPTVTLANGEPFHGTIQYAYKETGLFSLFTGYTDGLPTAAGEYTIKAYVAAEGNYTQAESTNTMTLTINRADNSINNSSTTSMYYGESFHIEYSIVNTDTTQPTFTCEYKERSANDNTYTTTLPTNAGNYAMRVSATATPNYNACSATQDFVINQAPLNVTAGTAEPKKWDGTKTATVTGLTFKNALISTPLEGDEALAMGTDFTVTKAEYATANVGMNRINATVVLKNTTKANNYFLVLENDGVFPFTGTPIALADGPATPTFSTMDDEMGKDTFTFHSTSATVYQYSKDSGATWTELTASGATTAITVGNVALAAGALQVRVKATDTHNASGVLANTAAQVFTASLDGSVALDKTTGVTYGDTLTATVSDTQSGAVLNYQWKADNVAISDATASTLKVPGSAVGKTITMEVTAAGYNGKLTSSATNAVAKKAVTATAGTVSKVYDGTDTATVSLSIVKVSTGDDITVTAPTAAYDNANVGTGKAITLGDLSISGTAAGWYTVTPPTNVTGTITAKALTDATVTVGGAYTYTGSEITPTAENITVKDGTTTLTNGTDYSYAASDNKSAGTATVTVTLKGNYTGTASKTFTIAKATPTYTAPTGLTAKYGQTLSAVTLTTGFSWMDGTKSVGGVDTRTHKAKFTPADTANYNTVENIDVTVTVGKADAFALNSSAIMVKKQANYTVKLDMAKVSGYPAILGGKPAFAITSGASYNGLTSATMDADGKTLVLVANNSTNDIADSVIVNVTGMGNYSDSTITVAVSYTDKIPVTITGVTAQDGTYYGSAQKGYIGTPTSAFTDSYNVTYTGRDGTTYNSSNAPKNVGDYTVTISVPDSDATYFGNISLNFAISKATVTIKAANKSAYVGDTQPALTYTATGLATGESLQTVPTLTCTPDMSKAGSYAITAGGAVVPNTDNYNSDITYTVGTLTVSTRPSSGGGDSGSGGSSGGGTVTPPAPKPEPPKTDPGTGNTEVSVPVKPVTKGDTSSATVPEKAVSDAIAAAEKEAAKTGGSASVAITVDAPKGAKTVETTLPSKSLSAVADGKTEGLKISTPVADLSFDSEALKNIAGMAGKDVKISAAQVDTKALTDTQKSQVGDAPVFDFTVTSDGKTISNFNGGTATVSVPYTPKEGENPEFITVWLLDDAGKLIPIEASYKDGKISFETGHFSRYAIGYLPFTDVKAGWAYESIVYAYQNKLFSGVGGNKFAPTANMNRAMLWTVLYRMAGSPGKTETPANWYADAQKWAIANGISDGTNPDGNITREQLATILFRYAKAAATAADMSSFIDTDEISGFAKDGMSWAVANQILQGNSGKLNPQGNATRAEVATILRRYVELAIDKAAA